MGEAKKRQERGFSHAQAELLANRQKPRYALHDGKWRVLVDRPCYASWSDIDDWIAWCEDRNRREGRISRE